MMLACESSQDWAWTACSGGGWIRESIALSKTHLQKFLRKPPLAVHSETYGTVLLAKALVFCLKNGASNVFLQPARGDEHWHLLCGV